MTNKPTERKIIPLAPGEEATVFGTTGRVNLRRWHTRDVDFRIEIGVGTRLLYFVVNQGNISELTRALAKKAVGDKKQFTSHRALADITQVGDRVVSVRVCDMEIPRSGVEVILDQDQIEEIKTRLRIK